ncbi:MAG: response regulator [Steroidobacteraceae bacterium]|nr:response regulator [Deltaproteobacteria bacterium]
MAIQTPDKILIVEDEPDIALALKIALESAGYEPACAGDGETALKILLGSSDYHLALLDIRMPGIDGVEVLKRLRNSNCDVATIMMSGHGSEDLAVECIKIGAEDYLSKPFVLDDMLQRVDRARSHRLAVIEKKRLEQEREDFFMMLSHDMKNPMTAVIGSIDIMREGRLGPVNEEQVEYLQSAIDSCNEVVMMIDNLLDIRRFEVGKMQLSIQPYNPVEIVRKVATQFSRAAERDGIRLSLDLKDDVPGIAVDRNALTRIMGNLLGNSLKFTPEGGEIAVSCNCIEPPDLHLTRIPPYISVPTDYPDRQCFVMLTVRDTGTGIPSDELKCIFDRYTQSSSSSGRERGGAGLGLSFCKLAVESFGGVIWAESEAGQGSEFIILLPCVAK